MAFFLETLLGGLMVGMLYSLVALGFVLIFKASGVFNFAQGAMVLFAALAMARLPNGFPQWTGIESKVLANLAAFVLAGALMFVAGMADRAAGAAPPGQPGGRHAADGHAGHHLLSGWHLGQTIFGSNVYKLDIGMPKEPSWRLRSFSRAAS
jgi:branched-chain amino acid transport system permease protein